MSHKLARSVDGGQPLPLDQDEAAGSSHQDQHESAAKQPRSSTQDLDRVERSQLLDLERAVGQLAAIVTAKGWTSEALRAEGVAPDASYIAKVLRADKSMSFAFFMRLPREVRHQFYADELERDGAMVIRPDRGEAAIRRFVASLLGILTDQAAAVSAKLPMAKASLPPGVTADRRHA